MWHRLLGAAAAGTVLLATSTRLRSLLARRLWMSATSAAAHKRVLVAVSGTIQDGFELRKNIDFRAEGEPTVEALLIGHAVMRGVKMFFDIKDEWCREFDPKLPHRVNPAMVLSGCWTDAIQYALYLVDERACLNALLGEPRLLTMAPDAVRIDLDDKDTSPAVAALARAFIASDGKSNTKQCAVLAVVPCYASRDFVPAPPMERRADGTHLTSFRASLSAFAGLPLGVEPGTAKWNEAVARALKAQRDAIATSGGSLPSGVGLSFRSDDRLYGTDKDTARLSRRLSADEFNAVAASAGLTLRCM